MILLSLEDSHDVALCDGRQRVHGRTHPREHLHDGVGEGKQMIQMKEDNIQFQSGSGPCQCSEIHASASQVRNKSRTGRKGSKQTVTGFIEYIEDSIGRLGQHG